MSGWTLRGWLTVLSGGLFLAAGTLLPAVTYLTVGASLNRRVSSDPAVVAALPTIPSSAREDEGMARAIGELHAAERPFRDETMDAPLAQGALSRGSGSPGTDGREPGGERRSAPHGGRVGGGPYRRGAEPGGAVLTVSNTGPPVPSHEAEALFQPFRRLNRTRVGGGRGYGLGLPIVRATARAHGGRAHAPHRGGGGLTVTVALPGRTSSEALDAAERAACHGEGHAWP